MSTSRIERRARGDGLPVLADHADAEPLLGPGLAVALALPAHRQRRVGDEPHERQNEVRDDAGCPSGAVAVRAGRLAVDEESDPDRDAQRHDRLQDAVEQVRRQPPTPVGQGHPRRDVRARGRVVVRGAVARCGYCWRSRSQAAPAAASSGQGHDARAQTGMEAARSSRRQYPFRAGLLQASSRANPPQKGRIVELAEASPSGPCDYQACDMQCGQPTRGRHGGLEDVAARAAVGARRPGSTLARLVALAARAGGVPARERGRAARAGRRAMRWSAGG